MNTRKTYSMLGEAVGFFERSQKRNRTTVEQELVMLHGKGGPHPWSMIGYKKWYRLLLDLVGDARKDFKKNFTEEHQEWLESVSVSNLLRLALRYRDRWATSTPMSRAVPVASR